MIKYSIKGKDQQDIQKGSKKEYFDKLKVSIPRLLHIVSVGSWK